MPLVKLYERSFLEIAYDEEHKWLHTNWKGYQTDQSIKTGINRLIDLIAERQVYKVLNDNTNALGIWLGVATWLVFDALPRAKNAGLQSFAHVYGPSQLSRFSAKAALALLLPVAPQIKAFDQIHEAKEWLAHRS